MKTNKKTKQLCDDVLCDIEGVIKGMQFCHDLWADGKAYAKQDKVSKALRQEDAEVTAYWMVQLKEIAHKYRKYLK